MPRTLPPVSDAGLAESAISAALALAAVLRRARSEARSSALRRRADNLLQDLDGMLTDAVTEIRGAMQEDADEAEASGATAAERDRWQPRYRAA